MLENPWFWAFCAMWIVLAVSGNAWRKIAKKGDEQFWAVAKQAAESQARSAVYKRTLENYKDMFGTPPQGKDYVCPAGYCRREDPDNG